MAGFSLSTIVQTAAVRLWEQIVNCVTKADVFIIEQIFKKTSRAIFF